jgi:hypothetical protein
MKDRCFGCRLRLARKLPEDSAPVTLHRVAWLRFGCLWRLATWMGGDEHGPRTVRTSPSETYRLPHKIRSFGFFACGEKVTLQIQRRWQNPKVLKAPSRLPMVSSELKQPLSSFKATLNPFKISTFFFLVVTKGVTRSRSTREIPSGNSQRKLMDETALEC